MQPLGTPPAPAAPVVTDLQAGANQTNLRTVAGDLPEGPGPTVYTVTYSNGTRPVRVPAAEAVALTCTHSGVPYDGLDLHLPRAWRPTSPR